MPRGPSTRESGQAVVESALTLPLTVFLVLGTLQLFLMLQGRILTQYAVFRATRAGSMAYGDCTRMTHAAIASLMPSITSYLGNSGGPGTPGAKLAHAFNVRITNKYSGTDDKGHLAPSAGMPGNADIVWIARDNPTMAQVAAYGVQDRDFDQPNNNPNTQRLEVRMVFWFPLSIPFANWVMSRMMLAQYGLTAFTANNPLMPTQTANWTSGGPLGDAPVAAALQSRVVAGEYVFPITASYSMRMMTPVVQSKWVTKNCPPAPPTLQ